jgi:hypothetical protein
VRVVSIPNILHDYSKKEDMEAWLWPVINLQPMPCYANTLVSYILAKVSAVCSGIG